MQIIEAKTPPATTLSGTFQDIVCLGEVSLPIMGRGFCFLIQLQDVFSPQLPPDSNKNI